MKIRLALQGIRAPADLGNWHELSINCGADFMQGNADRHCREFGMGGKVFERARERILSYQMFPRSRVQVLLSAGTQVNAGVTVVQHARMGIFEFEMANRILEVFDRSLDEIREAGFNLASVQGHAEQGVETFKVTLDRAGKVNFHIIAWSRPGHWLTRLFKPLTRWIQLKATGECLAHLKAEASRE